MKILVATDAWHPQINGVVRTLGHVAREARALGAELAFLSPDAFFTLPLPGYPEIRLALPPPGAVERRLDMIAPDAIHIATEGPLGHAMRRVCIRRSLPFTTSFHTRFPDYVAERLPLPERWSAGVAWAWLRLQPNSALSQWYQKRFGHGNSRIRRIGIVALARKLLIALWRYLETGEVPEGAVLKSTP